MIEVKGQSCIAGNWITPPGKTFSSFNPYKKESMYSFASCGMDEIEQAADAAENAFQAYRQLDGKAIGTFLNTIADEIDAKSEFMAETNQLGQVFAQRCFTTRKTEGWHVGFREDALHDELGPFGVHGGDLEEEVVGVVV